MSFSRWQKLIAARIEKVVRPAVWAGLRVAVAWLKKDSSERAPQSAGFAWKSLSLEGGGGPTGRSACAARPARPGLRGPACAARSKNAAHILVRHEFRTIDLHHY
jgi:hypothetical protein